MQKPDLVFFIKIKNGFTALSRVVKPKIENGFTTLSNVRVNLKFPTYRTRCKKLSLFGDKMPQKYWELQCVRIWVSKMAFLKMMKHTN